MYHELGKKMNNKISVNNNFGRRLVSAEGITLKGSRKLKCK